MSETLKQLQVSNFSVSLKQRIQALARSERRSLAQQIQILLEEALAAREGRKNG